MFPFSSEGKTRLRNCSCLFAYSHQSIKPFATGSSCFLSGFLGEFFQNECKTGGWKHPVPSALLTLLTYPIPICNYSPRNRRRLSLFLPPILTEAFMRYHMTTWKTLLCDFSFSAKSRQEKEKQPAMIGQLLAPVDLVCQPISVIIFHACRVDPIYTACVLFIRHPVWRVRAHPHACRLYCMYPRWPDSSGLTWAADI